MNLGLTGEDLPFHTYRKPPFSLDHLELDRLRLIPSEGNQPSQVSVRSKQTEYKISESSLVMQVQETNTTVLKCVFSFCSTAHVKILQFNGQKQNINYTVIISGAYTTNTFRMQLTKSTGRTKRVEQDMNMYLKLPGGVRVVGILVRVHQLRLKKKTKQDQQIQNHETGTERVKNTIIVDRRRFIMLTHLEVVGLLDLGHGGVSADLQDVVVRAVLHHFGGFPVPAAPFFFLDQTATERQQTTTPQSPRSDPGWRQERRKEESEKRRGVPGRGREPGDGGSQLMRWCGQRGRKKLLRPDPPAPGTLVRSSRQDKTAVASDWRATPATA